jgi:hypothetical protein
MMYDIYWYCQMKKKRMIMKILKKEWFIWKLRGSFVSRSNYIIRDGNARTGTLGFLRMDYLQWKTHMRSEYFSHNDLAGNINRWKNITADGLFRKNGTTTIWICICICLSMILIIWSRGKLNISFPLKLWLQF